MQATLDLQTEVPDEAAELWALPASAAQQRFWVLDRIKPGDPSLNVAVRFGLTGRLRADILRRALNETVARHEILRASFAMVDGQVKQLVARALTLDLPVTDLRGAQAGEADRIAIEEARLPFVLDEGPLLRARLLRLDDEEHVLLITIHHIISDGWSIGTITDEVGPLYEAFLEGRPSPLPDLAIQYADFTLWEQENRDPALWQEAATYWRRQLADLPRFELLPDYPRGARGEFAGDIVSRLLPVELTGRLRELSRSHEVTLFMTMLAALATLLHRYTGETDIVMGSQVAGRNVPDVEALIGPFINTLVLRNDASGDPTFAQMLARVRGVVSGALEHQQYPLDKVAEVLRLERSPDSNLLFQINFIYQRDFVHPWEHGGVRMRPIPSKSPGAMYDLNVFLVERADGWRVSCEYNTDLYAQATVARLLEHFEGLLNAVLANPQGRLSEFEFLTRDEQRRILVEWNATHAEYPRERCVHHLFEEQVERTPRAVALVFGRHSVTYAELNRRANQLARVLRKRGVAAGSLVGICLDRSPDMVAAILATLKAGGAYVPLDPSFPKDRLAFMAQDSGLRVLITERSLAGAFECSATALVMEDERAGLAKEPGTNLERSVAPQSLAYVIYTSGSTGTPKGVAVHHRALVNLLCAAIREPGIHAGDSLLAVTTLSFDIAGLELFGPLLAGARIVLASKAAASDGRALRELIEGGGSNILQATAATWRMLIEAGWAGTPKLKMLCGGEALPRELADALLERGGELWNMYGPTETTIWSSWQRIEKRTEAISVGRPAPNQMFYILDAHRKPVPVGVGGELYIGGEGVATGYHNRPELTAERFLENPFAPGRMYRTGDRARYRPDGSVEVLGRMDSQVKIRGFRIELGEVESALAGCEQVRAAAVTVRQDASGQSILAGYFVPAGAADLEGVRAALQKRLPSYMIPAYLIPLSELPLTPNGKVDRKALPAPEPPRGQAPEEDLATHDTLETTLIGIWESVLNVRPIGRRDNFFEIGGHSVLAARMFARMEKVLGTTLPLATLFQGPTIEKLAALLRDRGWTPPWSSLVPIRPNGSQPPFFFVHPIGGNVLSFAGFASHFDADQPVYGLQARGLDGKEKPRMCVEEMAEDYVREIRSVQPRGPYYIGGFSAGGIVAFEMARKLQETGEQVGVLALLDTKIDGPTDSSVAARAFSRWLRTTDFNVRYAFHIGLGRFLTQKVKNFGMRVNIRTWMMKHRAGLTPGTLNAEEAFLLALRHYRPRPLEGNAILFRAKNELLRLPDPTLGWGALIQGQLNILEVSGDHDTILQEPHIGRLARLLNDNLKSAGEAGCHSGDREKISQR
jgi:aspartate racemase